MIIVPAIGHRETCSMYWTRLTPEERETARELQRRSLYLTMTSWLLARGCLPVWEPPYPYKTAKKTLAARKLEQPMVYHDVTRRPVGYVR